MIKRVDIGILLASSIADRESGRSILETLVDVSPQYAPERFNNYEPIKREFDPMNLEAALKLWEWPFLWRRNRQRLLGSAAFGIKRAHHAVRLSMSLKAFDQAQTTELFEALESRFGVVLAYIHVHTGADIEDRDHYQNHILPFHGLTTHDLIYAKAFQA